MDDAQTRLWGILSATTYHTAHLNRIYWLSRSLVRLRHALDLYALLRHATNVRRACRASFAYASRSCYATDSALTWHWLGGGRIVVCLLLTVGMATQLWRLVRLVAFVQLPTGMWHFTHHACLLLTANVSPPNPLLWAKDVDIQLRSPRHHLDRRSRSTFLLRTRARNGLLRRSDALCRPHLRVAQPMVVTWHLGWLPL